MPLHFKGRNLHAHQPNQYRLENESGRVVLTHNNISSHPVYRTRLNETKNNDKNEVHMLGAYIANKVYNELNLGNTKRKINSMVEKILNHRKTNSKPHQAEYLRAMELYRARVAPLWASQKPHFNMANRLRGVINKGGQLTNQGRAALAEANRMNKHYKKLINAEEKLYERAVKKWLDHQAQIQYWQWVKNRVVPEVKRLLK
jgi:ribonucleotide monophosphatase NagD (HAD superfamily)